jgi:hypothetical protein
MSSGLRHHHQRPVSGCRDVTSDSEAAASYAGLRFPPLLPQLLPSAILDSALQSLSKHLTRPHISWTSEWNTHTSDGESQTGSMRATDSMATREVGE